MPDKLIVSVDPQIAVLVPRFLASRVADLDPIRSALRRGGAWRKQATPVRTG